MKKRLALIVIGICLLTGISAQASTWSLQRNNPSGQILNDIYFLTSLEGYAVGNAGIILKTTDAGANWDNLTTGITASIEAITGVGSTLFIGTAGGQIKKSINNGTSWTDTSITADVITKIWFADSNNGFAIGWTGAGLGINYYIWRTTNGGADWSTSLNLVLAAPISVHGSSNSNVWVTSVWGTYYKWNGTTWETDSVAGVSDNFNDLYVKNSQEVWLVGSKVSTVNNMHHTIDGGASWTNFNPADSSTQLWSVWFEGNHGWAGDNLGNIYHTSNAGTGNSDWSEQTGGLLTEPIISLNFVDENTGWALSNNSQTIFGYSAATTTSTSTTTTSTTASTTTTSTTTTTVPAHWVSPQYPSGGQYWNPDTEGSVSLHYTADATQAGAGKVILMQSAPPFTSYTRNITINTGDNRTAISAQSDFGDGYPNGIYKVLVFNNAGQRVASGKIVVYR